MEIIRENSVCPFTLFFKFSLKFDFPCVKTGYLWDWVTQHTYFFIILHSPLYKKTITASFHFSGTVMLPNAMQHIFYSYSITLSFYHFRYPSRLYILHYIHSIFHFLHADRFYNPYSHSSLLFPNHSYSHLPPLVYPRCILSTCSSLIIIHHSSC